MMKRHGVYALLLLSLIGGSAYSQENQLVTGTIVQRPAQQVVSDDTIPAINLSEEELDNIVDIRKQFEKQNKTYSEPLAPSTNLLRFLKKDELEISDEAMYWARLVRDASTIFDNTMTFRDRKPFVHADRFPGRLFTRELDILQLRFVEGEDSL